MAERTDVSRAELGAMLALAEGRPLSARQRARVEGVDMDVDGQRTVVAALHSGGPVTPAELGTRVAALCAEPRSKRQRRAAMQPAAPRPASQRIVAALCGTTRARGVGALAATAASTALVVVLATGGGAGSRLTAERVARLWNEPATAGRPAPAPRDPEQLAARFRGVAFPNYRDAEGWHPSGSRSDRIDGHAARTVFYAVGDRRAAYTIVDASSVRVPRDARRLVFHGLRVSEFRTGDRWIVVFPRSGRTCVLTAAAPRERVWLLKLAAWPSGTRPA